MTKRFSNWLYRYTNAYTIIAFAALFLLHLFVILPSERDVDRIIGTGSGILQYFKYFVYSPDDFYAALDGLGEQGRKAFIDHRIIKANIFIFSIGSFFTICTGALLRIGVQEGNGLRLLNVVGFTPAFCDVVENHVQMILVFLYPERFDSIVIIITTFTAVKWVTLLAAMLIFLFAAAASVVAILKRAGGNRTA
jgi:hypothetical protein